MIAVGDLLDRLADVEQALVGLHGAGGAEADRDATQAAFERLLGQGHQRFGLGVLLHGKGPYSCSADESDVRNGSVGATVPCPGGCASAPA